LQSEDEQQAAEHVADAQRKESLVVRKPFQEQDAFGEEFGVVRAEVSMAFVHDDSSRPAPVDSPSSARSAIFWVRHV
jgi:hypothetical protein